jgi:hypothetical protein
VAKTATKKIEREGRKRRVAAWTLLLLGLLVAAVWVASGWWSIQWGRLEWRIRLREGVLENVHQVGTESSGWRVRPVQPGIDWILHDQEDARWNWQLVSRRSDGTHYSNTSVIVWPIPLLLWTPAALLLGSGSLARRRATTGQCVKCGYSLVGLALGSPCPECGTTA